MDGFVLVALVGLLVLGILGVIALSKKGRIDWEMQTGDRVKTKVAIDGSAQGKPEA